MKEVVLQSLTKVLSGLDQSPAKPLEDDPSFFLRVSRPPTHFQNLMIVSVDERQLVKIRSSSSDGQTPDSRWSLLPSGARFQVERVLGPLGEGLPDLTSVPRALVRPFRPSIILNHDHQRRSLNRTYFFVGEMAV